MVGADILEIDTTLLSVMLLGECRVCSEYFGQTYVCFRCRPVSDFPAANARNADWPPPTGRQLCGMLWGQLSQCSKHVESGVQCRVSSRHFEKIIVGNGRPAGRHELLLYGIELEHRKADRGEEPQCVSWSQRRQK